MLLIIGSPNAGKTTLSTQFKNAYHGDDLRKQGLDLWEIIKEDGAVIEGIFNNAETRRRILETCSRPAVCIFLDITFEECLRRENRGRREWYLRMLYDRIEPPTMAEGWDELIVIKGEKDGEVITSGTGGSPD
jgi:tRNA uridine 5-carbamoylmethylation protein Kti12